MRLDNVPQSVGMTILGVTTLIAGFPVGVLCGLAAWVVAFGVQIAFIAPLPRYDHATPAPLIFQPIGLLGMIALVYIVFRLGALRPDELWFLSGYPWIGAILTGATLAFAPAILEPMVWSIFRRATP